jgi:glycosyltransferase involved in cell wall biosynthesis
MIETKAPTSRPTALIFQKRLLRWSETFIAAQGGALGRYRPVFIGYQHSSGGAAYLDGHHRILLADHTPVLGLGKFALKTFGRVAPSWRKALAEQNPTILHAHFGTTATVAIPIARALGIPLLVTYHGMDIAIEPRNAGQRAERARVFAAANRIIAVSEFIAERLRAAGCPPEKIVVHHIGIDTEHFSPGEARHSDTPRILFVGRLVAKKGLTHLLRAMPRVQESVEGVELIVAGDGPLRAELEAEARQLGVRCRFLGIQTPDQVRELMRQATLFCSPSVVAADGNAEGLPMTILEAQASALPVVAFPSGGSAEGIVHGETGLVAPPADEEMLGQYLTELLTDRDRLTQFAAAARNHAVQRFDLRRQTALLEEIYDEVRGR